MCLSRQTRANPYQHLDHFSHREGGRVLKDALHKNTTLTSLNIKCNQLSSEV
ncbi:hypothetical protein C2G38_2060817, partial [Gigaspora rosea]